MRRNIAHPRLTKDLSGGIVFFDPYPKVIGGAQVVTLAVAEELQQRDVGVRILTTGGGALIDSARDAGLPNGIVEMPAPLRTYGHATVGSARLAAAASLPLAWWRMSRALRPRPAVVHVTDLRGLILAGPPARTLGIPVVWHLHATEPEPLLNSIGSFLATVALTPSQKVVSSLPPLVRRRCRVLRNGVPGSALDAPPARFEEQLVVSAGRISAEKGVDVLLEATVQLLQSVPDARVRVYGGVQPGWEDYHRRLVQRIDDEGLREQFELAGFVESPSMDWTQASLYVQPSRREAGLSLAVVEAMASGLPVVATSVGGLPEVVEDGVTGLLVNPEDPAALARGISDLLLDPDRSRRLGQAGRQRVASLYSMGEMVDSLMKLYVEIQ